MTEKSYIGTKIVRAAPMTWVEWKRSQGDSFPYTGKTQPGYRVRYEDGYISWSPKKVFERCYREISKDEKKMIKKEG